MKSGYLHTRFTKKKEVNNPIVEVAKVEKILSCYTDFPNPYYDLAHIVENIKNYQSKKKNKNKK